jgi:serine/threonine protein kinase
MSERIDPTAIAHYQIVEQLGEGGMGVVWKARDTHLDRFVAIKVLPSEAVGSAGLPRLVHEAKAASALNHPNIIHIYDVGECDGVPYIAMEYVGGKTLEELIGRHGLRFTEALKYGAQIADAMAVAHSAGIVHRDLKPTNIMITESGNAKVLDFGLAKLIEPPASLSGSTRAAATEGEGWSGPGRRNAFGRSLRHFFVRHHPLRDDCRHQSVPPRVARRHSVGHPSRRTQAAP